MKKTMQQTQKPKNINGNLIFVGCIILGSGIGMAMGNVAVGSIIGVGIGFLAKALIK